MFRFDIQAAASYAAAAAVALLSTTMLFAATVAPSVSSISNLAA